MTVRVTDHAVLQYLARVHGFDVEQIRQQIANTCKAAVAAGAQSIQRDGHHYVLTGNAVITVLPRGGRPNTHRDLARIRRTSRQRPISALVADEMD